MNCFNTKNKVSDHNSWTNEDKKIYNFLYHKISNFNELTEIEIKLIQELPLNQRTILCNLQNKCIVVLVSYLMMT
jgi:hypothetical protein